MKQGANTNGRNSGNQIMDTTFDAKSATARKKSHASYSRLHAPRRAFTLVELLVVITIIGILASLIVVAAMGALKHARQTQIKAELNQISDSLEHYKNEHTAYPPNCQTDNGGGSPPETPLDPNKVFSDLKRHIRQVAPRCQEPDDLLKAIAGINVSDTASFPRKLAGGLTAGEAVVFWLGGFSSNEKYPISGEGGPSYEIAALNNATNREQENLSAHKWVFPFEQPRLAPKDDNNRFDETDGRFIEYKVTIAGKPHIRRINFWQYTPNKSKQPYLYFDTSRYTPDVADPPASSSVHIHALKTIENPGSSNERLKFVNPDRYQLLHCGIDDVWGDAFDQTSYAQYKGDPTKFLWFPQGPFKGDLADTVVNFVTQTKLEDAQTQ